MSKKINGIKVYPKYGLGSFITSLLLLVSVGAVALISLFPIMSYKLGETVYSFTALQYVNYVLNTNAFFKLDVLNSIFPYAQDYFAAKEGFTPTLLTTSWYPQFSGYIDLAIAGSYLLLVIIALFAAFKFLGFLFTGKYSKGGRFNLFCSSLFIFIFVLGVFVTNFCYGYIQEEAGVTAERGYEIWPYVAWGAIFASWVISRWTYKLFIKDKLFVAKSRRISKRKVRTTEDDVEEVVEEQPVGHEKARIPKVNDGIKKYLVKEEDVKEEVKEETKEESTPEVKEEPEINIPKKEKDAFDDDDEDLEEDDEDLDEDETQVIEEVDEENDEKADRSFTRIKPVGEFEED